MNNKIFLELCTACENSDEKEISRIVREIVPTSLLPGIEERLSIMVKVQGKYPVIDLDIRQFSCIVSIYPRLGKEDDAIVKEIII